MVAKMAYGYILCFLFFQSLNCFMGREQFSCTNLLSNDWNAAKLKLDLFTATLNADLQRFCVLYTLSWTSNQSLNTMKWNYRSLHISIALILSFFQHSEHHYRPPHTLQMDETKMIPSLCPFFRCEVWKKQHLLEEVFVVVVVVVVQHYSSDWNFLR